MRVGVSVSSRPPRAQPPTTRPQHTVSELQAAASTRETLWAFAAELPDRSLKERSWGLEFICSNNDSEGIPLQLSRRLAVVAARDRVAKFGPHPSLDMLITQFRFGIEAHCAGPVQGQRAAAARPRF